MTTEPTTTAHIYIGASSWVDKSLVASGRFYPPDLKDTPSRLAFYAERFNLAEVDSTYYALPSQRNIERWAEAVPDGFRFNVKAFALFTQHPTRLSSIPISFRDDLPPAVRKKAKVYYKDIPPEVSAELWRIFRGALRPMREAGKLGAILVDFPPWFVPSEANRDAAAARDRGEPEVRSREREAVAARAERRKARRGHKKTAKRVAPRAKTETEAAPAPETEAPATEGGVDVASEKLWDVKVDHVRTMRYAGKTKRALLGRMARNPKYGRRPAYKKAVVQLAEGDHIEFYEVG